MPLICVAAVYQAVPCGHVSRNENVRGDYPTRRYQPITIFVCECDVQTQTNVLYANHVCVCVYMHKV